MDIAIPSLLRIRNALASIWVIPSVALLLVGAVLAWISHDEYQQTIEQEYRFLDAHARIAQERISELVRHVRQTLTRIDREAPRYLTRRHADTSWLADLHREVPDLHALQILSPAGRVELASDPKLVGFDDSKREYFTSHQDRPEASDIRVAQPYDTVYGDFSVAFSLPIRDTGGNPLGIAVAAIRYDRFDHAMTETRPAQANSAVAIIDDQGDFLYRHPDQGNRVGKNVLANPVFQQLLRTGKSSARGMYVSHIDGIERMYLMRGIQNSPLNIAMAVPVADVLAPWHRNLALRAVLFILGAVLILRLTWTAHRRQQEALAGKEFTDQIVETANAMMVVVDAESRVVAVNKAAESITGYRRDELIGRSIFDTAMPRDRYPLAWQSFLRYREGGALPRAFEAPILTQSGEERIVAWQNNGIFEHRGSLALLSFGIDVTERTQLEQVRAREEISRRLVSIQEEERRRLAIELHDRTSPNLTILGINLKLLANWLPKSAPPELADLIEDTSATLTDTIASIRSVSLDFRPPLLDYAGLWPALTAYARQFSKRTGISAEVVGQQAMLRLPPDVETTLFHIVQEALANCARHSHAETVLIRQTCHGDELILMICDDGAGFAPAACSAGTGLTTMRQRAEFIGGKLYVDSHPGKGTCVAIRFASCAASGYCEPSRRANSSPASHNDAPSPAARPLAKQAVSR